MAVSSETIQRFESSLDEIGVGRSRTTAEALQQELKRTVREPAVGVSIPLGGVSLDESSITTNPTPAEFESAKTGVTTAEIGIASYGSLVIEDTPDGTDAVSLFPEFHVAVVRASDVVESMPAAFERLGPLIRDEGASVILETGPSATADMGSLVYGAHGPETVHVIIVTDR